MKKNAYKAPLLEVDILTNDFLMYSGETTVDLGSAFSDYYATLTSANDQ